VHERKLVTADDLDFAPHDADAAGSPDAVITRITAALNDPSLRDESFSAPYAMVVVSDLHETFGRPAQAEATLRAAVSADLHDDYTEPRASLVALLARLGRPGDAAAEFAELKRLGRAGVAQHEMYGQALEQAGDLDGALRIFAAGALLAERVGDAMMQLRLDEAAMRVRAGSTEHKVSNPLFAEPAFAGLRSALVPDDARGHGPNGWVVFWPKGDHERLIAVWPDLASQIGGTWHEHRARIERVLTQLDEQGTTPVLTRADFAEFKALADERDAAPTGETIDAYVRMANHSTNVLWPPKRNDPCWCGTGQPYKRCCRMRPFLNE
jgi:tetratricopeptide (TPR) repeat protein